ncbi:transporter [Flavobacteriaceae bacterium Ap0902]|nr:transporter [Flavobacteriaceae bacterium Ap0902]
MIAFVKLSVFQIKIRRMKNILILLFISLLSTSYAQTVTIDEAYQWSKENLPIYQQKELLKEQTKRNLSNTHKAYLPQVNLQGQATYQTDVTSIPIEIPGIEIEDMSKDQYQLVAEVNQLIYDGGNIKNKQERLQLSELMQLQEVEITLYNLRQRVSDLYFGILLTEEQIKQRKYIEETLQATLDQAEVALDNGVTAKADVNELKAELIASEQQRIEIQYKKEALIRMLEELTGHQFTDNVVFKTPEPIQTTIKNQRPEMEMFKLRQQMLEIERKKLNQHWHPQIGAFVQGGYGRPGLNMLDNDFKPFAIGGVRLSIPLSGFYTQKNELEKLEIESAMIDTELQTFEMNTRLESIEEENNIQKFEELIAKDAEIIALRQEVLESAKAQLNYGVITSHEFINKLNATYIAQITKSLHQLQQLKSQYQQLIITGN